MKQVKTNLNLNVLLNLLESKSPSQISKELNISKQALNYYLKTLKANGNIQKKGYGVWEVKNNTYNTFKKEVKIRGHAFIWKIKINKDFDWSKFKLKKLKNVYQIMINNKKIWLSHRKVTIYENKDFNGIDALESRRLATIEMVKDLSTLNKTLGINFNYGFKVAREHYAMTRNELANYYNSRKEKMVIKDDFGEEYLWIDFSDGIDELETNKMLTSKKVQDWWNDNKRHDFKITPTFLMESINQVTNNQLMFAKNIETHIQVLKDIGNAIDDLRKEIKKQNNKSDKLINKSLFDY
jgi:biotin operon repressor